MLTSLATPGANHVARLMNSLPQCTGMYSSGRDREVLARAPTATNRDDRQGEDEKVPEGRSPPDLPYSLRR